MQVEGTRYLRVKSVAEMFDVSEASIYRAIRSGQLDALRIGGSVRVPSDALRVFTAACGAAAVTTTVAGTAEQGVTR
ncbi:MAG: helix-turn-helix domain-containing protein [Pseudonocardia sp.]